MSYRSCSKVCSILANYYRVPVPHYSTIRQWVLRLGYYVLQKTKAKCEDWVYIVDYTVNASRDKCLAILGVSLNYLRDNSFNLKMKDVTLLHLSTTPKATWEVTYNALIKTSKQTGVPKQIISDHGADVKKGIEEFCKQNQQTHYVYDTTHLSACCLKSILIDDPKWDRFIKRMAKCKNQAKQSAVSFLSPPSQRAKARFLNVGQLVGWAEKICRYQEIGDFTLVEKSIIEKKTQSGHQQDVMNQSVIQESIEIFNQKFDWIQEYSCEIKQYREYLFVIKTVKKKIIEQGINFQTLNQIKQELFNVKLSRKTVRLKELILTGLTLNLPKNPSDDDIYLGVSDIIESLFGKYKYYCSENALMGMTQSILIIAAATMELGINPIREAMNSHRYSDVQSWAKYTIGESDFCKRKKAFRQVGDSKAA